jgi:GDPmannose 4,6-dehydratase
MFACSGILYNHESERRPESFVSRKATRAAAAIKLGLAGEVVLGDLDAVRDWSFAGDVVDGAWLMLQQERPDDYILASGVPHTVGELAEIAFARVGLEARNHIRVDPSLVRAPEPTPLIGDASRARERLGWRPTLSFEALIERMVDADLVALTGAAAR